MTTTTNIRPFRVAVPEVVLADLHDRLDRARLPNWVNGIGWDQGIEQSTLTRLVEHWRDGFDWRAQEERLNRFDHFMTLEQRQPIHFVQARSTRPDALPLLLVHGWPGSFHEFLDVIPLLTEPPDGEDGFDVVVPSVPGFCVHRRSLDGRCSVRPQSGTFAYRYIVRPGAIGIGNAKCTQRVTPCRVTESQLRGEDTVAEMLILEFEGVTESDYRSVSAQLGIDPDTGEGDRPAGQITHLSGLTGDGRLIIVETWTSREAQAEFMKNRLRAAMAQGGVTATPKATWSIVLGSRGGGGFAR